MQLNQPALQPLSHHLQNMLRGHDWAILTATQESAGPATNAENQQANTRLLKELERRGHLFIRVAGNYKGVDQGDSFLVAAVTEKEAAELGRMFNQESVLVPRGLLYVSGPNAGTFNPVDHAQTVVGAEAEKLPFFSKVVDVAFCLGIDFRRSLPAL